MGLLSQGGAIQAAADSTEHEEEVMEEGEEGEMCESDEEGAEMDADGRCRKRKRRILFSKSQTYELERR